MEEHPLALIVASPGRLREGLRAVLAAIPRLLRQQGRAAEGRALLDQCYGWFTEGLDMPDLQAARKLLEELSVPEVQETMV
jgi:hypothetical protein